MTEDSVRADPDETIVAAHEFQPKWYLNGFPKSGLHWVALMLVPYAKPLPPAPIWDKAWAGTFRYNSWSEEWETSEKVTYKIGRLMDGYYLKGHCGYREEIERFLWYLGAAHVFIYRDFRDVAVSQAFHVLDDDDRFAHPDKKVYQDMASFEDVLKAVITGVDKFPGVMQRWAYYAPWLDVHWTHPFRYEDMFSDPVKAVSELLAYGLARVSGIYGCRLTVNRDTFDFMVQAMIASGKRTELSATFRKGSTGDWREHFTPEIKALFKESDRDGWLVRLGYEEGDDW